MVFTTRVVRAGNVAVRHQQLGMLPLAQRRQQAVFTGAGRTDQPNQFSCHQKTLLPCRQTRSIWICSPRRCASTRSARLPSAITRGHAAQRLRRVLLTGRMACARVKALPRRRRCGKRHPAGWRDNSRRREYPVGRWPPAGERRRCPSGNRRARYLARPSERSCRAGATPPRQQGWWEIRRWCCQVGVIRAHVRRWRHRGWPARYCARGR